MIKAVIRIVFRLAVLGGVLWLARVALKRWVDGPAASEESQLWPEPAPAPEKAAGPVSKPNPNEKQAWAQPMADGAVPAGHPVKAKLASRLYHLPGMAAYDRTRPDRCYASPQAAEADGFSRAKR